MINNTLDEFLAGLYVRPFFFVDIPLVRNSWLDFGMVSRPWLDFEEKINRYRVQGTMYTERVNIMNSADFGLTYVCLLGGKMPKESLEDYAITSLTDRNYSLILIAMTLKGIG
ncbi:MAG: hypothetical protein IH591_02270 [Bacteroidales bacterium]|nr:hypothetical protein [Bacteroidales bacterium]